MPLAIAERLRASLRRESIDFQGIVRQGEPRHTSFRSIGFDAALEALRAVRDQVSAI
jgi:hypothetical protein